jgi:predicted transcriptional regulator
MATKLEASIRSKGLKPSHVAKRAGYSRQHLLRLRQGKMEATRKCIAAITAACRSLSGRKVKAADLFDLDGV